MNKRAGRTELRANHIAIAVAAAFAPWSAYGQTPAPEQMPTGDASRGGDAVVNAPRPARYHADRPGVPARASYEVGSMLDRAATPIVQRSQRPRPFGHRASSRT